MMFSRLPAISIPICGTGAISGQRERNIEVSEINPVGQPLGLRVIRQFGDDDLVLKVGELLETKKKLH
jgi:hypothetical protein